MTPRPSPGRTTTRVTALAVAAAVTTAVVASAPSFASTPSHRPSNILSVQSRYAAWGAAQGVDVRGHGLSAVVPERSVAARNAERAGRGYRWQPLTTHLPPALTCVASDFNLRGSLVAYSDELKPGWRFIQGGKDVPLSPTANGITYPVVRPYRVNFNDQVAGIVRIANDQGQEQARVARWSPNGSLTVAPASTDNNQMDDLRVIAINARGDVVVDSRTAHSAALWQVDKGVITEIKPPAGFREFLPDGLTDGGNVTGSLVKEEADPAMSQAVTWNPASGFTFLKGLNGSDDGYISGTSPNGLHLIGGSAGSINPYDPSYVVRFQNNSPATLLLPTTNDHAQRFPHSVNNVGTVMLTSTYDTEPTLVEGTTIIDVASVTTGLPEKSILTVTRLDDRGRLLASVDTLNPSPGVENTCQVGMLVPTSS